MSMFMNSFQESSYTKQQQQKAERLQEVRRQEQLLAKRSVKDFKKQKESKKQQEDISKKQEEYFKMLKEIEELEREKEKALFENGEADRKALEQEQKQQEIKRNREQKVKETKEMSQLRFKDAQEWKRTQWLQSEEGKQFTRVQQLKEASYLEKQKESSKLEIFKQNKPAYSQDLDYTHQDYNELLDKSKRSCVLKPEDFSKTHFHNPVVLKHDFDEEKENAVEKANSIYVETQSQLEITAKMWREQERLQKERGRKAISKEREAKILEDLENEAQFLKKKEFEDSIQKQKKPFLKKSTGTRVEQEKLSQAFNQMMVDKSEKEKYGEWKEQKAPKSTSKTRVDKPPQKSPSVKKQQPPKTVKVFTKKPLDTGLYKTEESTNSLDYTNYPLASPETDDKKEFQNTEKKKVTFYDQVDKEKPNLAQSVQEFKNSRGNLKGLVDLEEQRENHFKKIYQETSPQNNQEPNSELEELSEQIEGTPVSEQGITSNSDRSPTYKDVKGSQITDIKTYIKQQEEYLSKLESERLRITNQMQQEEQFLIKTIKETDKIIRDVIPEEESLTTSSLQEDHSTYKERVQGSANTFKNIYETDDYTVTSNPSYLNAQNKFETQRQINKQQFTSPEEERSETPERNAHQYTFQFQQNQLQSPTSEQFNPSQSSPYSPEQKLISQQQVDTQDLMRRFLQPKKESNTLKTNTVKYDGFIRKSQEKQQMLQKQLSPGSEVSFSISDN